MSDKDEDKQVTVVKNATDLQRLKLEKLMKNPEKPAFIPDRPKDKRFSDPAEFVRNVMGSSAGAGSGEFHVYRHIRRREYARQDFLQNWKAKDDLDVDYHLKIIENRRAVEDKASKKRAKRQRQKEKQKAKRQKLKEMKKKGITVKEDSSSSSSSSEDEEEKEEVEEKMEEGGITQRTEAKKESSGVDEARVSEKKEVVDVRENREEEKKTELEKEIENKEKSMIKESHSQTSEKHDAERTETVRSNDSKEQNQVT